MKKIFLGILATIVGIFVLFAGYVYHVNRPLPANEYDIAILDRTIGILGNEQQWSKSGDRECESDLPPFNLYCALRQASIDLTGEFHHRSAALQQVRYAIERQRPEADYAHRLMDYNNDPATSYEDVLFVLQAAREQLVQ